MPLGAVPMLSWCGEVSLGGKQSSSSPTQNVSLSHRVSLPHCSRTPRTSRLPRPLPSPPPAGRFEAPHCASKNETAAARFNGPLYTSGFSAADRHATSEGTRDAPAARAMGVPEKKEGAFTLRKLESIYLSTYLYLHTCIHHAFPQCNRSLFSLGTPMACGACHGRA